MVILLFDLLDSVLYARISSKSLRSRTRRLENLLGTLFAKGFDRWFEVLLVYMTCPSMKSLTLAWPAPPQCCNRPQSEKRGEPWGRGG